MGRTVELFDCVTDTAVRLSWPADESREPVVRFEMAGGRALTLPASVVQLAAAVLRDPEVLARTARA